MSNAKGRIQADQAAAYSLYDTCRHPALQQGAEVASEAADGPVAPGVVHQSQKCHKDHQESEREVEVREASGPREGALEKPEYDYFENQKKRDDDDAGAGYDDFTYIVRAVEAHHDEKPFCHQKEDDGDDDGAGEDEQPEYA